MDKTILQLKAHKWHDTASYIQANIKSYEGEALAFNELLQATQSQSIKKSWLEEKCKVLSDLGGQIASNQPELAECLNNFSAISEEIFSDSDNFDDFKKILKKNGWLTEIEAQKRKEREEEELLEKQRKQAEGRRQEEEKRKEQEKQQRKKQQQYDKYNWFAKQWMEQELKKREREKQRKKKKQNWIWAIILWLVTMGGVYLFWYKPYSEESKTPRYYTFTNLNLRSTETSEDDHNLISMLTYGTELITYSINDEWAKVKANGKIGFVSANLILSANDFHLLNGIWGNPEAKDCVETAKCRLALLDYYKRSSMQNGSEWQLYAKATQEKTNNVFFIRLFDKNSQFPDFAFLLKNNRTGLQKFVLYSFDDETEKPIYRCDMDAPKDASINNITGFLISSDLQMTVCYSNGLKKTVSIPTDRPIQNNNIINKHYTTNNSTELTGLELNLQGNKALEKKDYKRALQYYKEAADKGYDEAFANLGWMSFKGYGTPKDGTIAISYLKDAIELGNANACYYLGFLYEHGVYESQLFKDKKLAIYYYKLGAERGQKNANDAYLRLTADTSSTTSTTSKKISLPASGLVFNKKLNKRSLIVNNPFRQKGGSYTIAFWTDDFSSRTVLQAIHPNHVGGWEFPKITFQPNGIFLLGTEDRSSVSYTIFTYDMTQLAGRHFICVICQPNVYQKEKLLYIDGKFISSLPNPQVSHSQSSCPTIQIGKGIESIFFYIKALSDNDVYNLYKASR